MRCVAVAGLALLLSGSGAIAQTAVAPADRPQTKNTARLSGRVVAADTGTPLRRASVTINVSMHSTPG
jgi:hypothetical protein